MPSTSSIRAPCTRVAAILPSATLPLRHEHRAREPALAAYAAARGDVLPVEAHTTAFARPPRRPWRSRASCPRSLNDPVGLAPSYFSQTSHPVSTDSGSDRTSGVPPSPRVMTGVASVTGRRSRYSSITPRHWCGPTAGGAHSSPSTRRRLATARTRRAIAQLGHRLLEGALLRPVRDERRAWPPRRTPPARRARSRRRCAPNASAISASTPGRSSTWRLR